MGVDVGVEVAGVLEGATVEEPPELEPQLP